MELDEIKSAWNELNVRLEKTEAINKQILSELLSNRRISARKKLMNYEVSFLYISVISGILFIPAFFTNLYPFALAVLLEAILFLAALWQVYKIYLLRKMDVARCATTELVQRAIRFKLITKMRTIVGMFLLIPILGVMYYLEKDHGTYMLVAMGTGCVIGLTIGLIMFFRNLSAIDVLIKSLKDSDDPDTN